MSIDSAALAGKRVTLHYRKPVAAPLCRSSSGYFVDRITYEEGK